MKLRLMLLPAAMLLLSATSAFAWPACSGNWNQVPNGTSSAGGAIYTSGGLTWQCQPKTPPPPPTDPSGQKQQQQQNQNQTANGGAGGAGGQGGAGGNATGGSVSGSGNSNNKNTNTNTANGGAGGNASSSSSAQGGSASNNSTGSGNSTSISTSVEAPKIPVATAFAPTTIPTVTCFKGFGAGVQTAPVGASFGGGKIDENCAILESAQHAPNRLAFCKVYVTNKYVKKAGVTLADCMGPDPVQIVEKPVEVIREVPVEKIVTITVAPPFVNQLVGVCTFASQFSCNLATKRQGDPVRVTTICDQMLNQAIAIVRTNPGTVIKLVGNQNGSEAAHNTMYSLARAKNVQRRLVALGLSTDLITTASGTTGDRTVEVWVVTK